MELKTKRIRIYEWCKKNKDNAGAEMTTSWISTHDWNNIRGNVNQRYAYAKVQIAERNDDRVKIKISIQ